MIAAVRALLARLRGVWSSAKHEPQMQEELAHDLALMVEDGERRGLSHTEARRQALLQLGGLEQTMQAVRDRRTLPAVEEILQDIRFAARQLRRRPGFTLAAVLTLALGFGASIAIFAFVDAAIIKPLPFRDPGRLAWVTETVEIMGPANLSWQDYEDWKARSHSFESFAAWRYGGYELRVDGSLVPASGIGVSANFLSTLGLRPALGRDFNERDNLPGGPKIVMLTHQLWQDKFGADPSILQRTIEMNGDPYTVIGVLPAEFQFPPRGRLDVVTPVQPTPGSCDGRRSCHSLNGVARLLPGVTIAQANEEVQRIAKALEVQYPDSNRGQGGVAMPLTEEIVGKVRPVLYVLLSAALLLCAIACINVASLLLARSESRRREFALRSALGASYLRMLRQFAVESSAIVLLGAIGGAVFAGMGVHAIMLLVPKLMHDRMPFLDAVGLNRDTLLFTAGTAAVAFLLFTIVPALRVSLRALHRAMAEGSAGAGSLSWRRLGSLLVIAEVAVAVILLAGAGLLSRSLFNLLHTDLNFTPDHLVTVSIGVPVRKFPTDEAQLAIEKRVQDRLAQLPGVTSIGFGDLLPVNFNGNTSWVRFSDRLYDGKHNEVLQRTASTTYFQTLQVALLKGRFFSETDTLGKPAVVIVNRRFAEMYFPGQDPLGKTFDNPSRGPSSMRTIVGVVEDLHEGALDDSIWPAYYSSAYQDTDTFEAMVLRVSGGEEALMKAIPQAVHSVDPDLGITQMETMAEHINNSQSAVLHRGAAWLAGTFAVLALILCAIGLYGVVSYSVSLRTREIGVRMALGAPRERIYRLVLREGSQLSLAGIVIGILLSAVSMTLLQAVLFRVSRWDIPTLTMVCIALTLCSLAACLLPARRAALSSPVEALRTD